MSAFVRFAKKYSHKKVQVPLQAFLAVVWFILIWPSITVWKESIPWLVFISVYTVTMEHINALLTKLSEEKDATS